MNRSLFDASWCLSPIRRNSVLDELRVKRLAVTHCRALCRCVGLSLTGDTTDGSGDESDVLYEAQNASSNVACLTVNSSNVAQVTRSQV